MNNLHLVADGKRITIQ